MDENSRGGLDRKRGVHNNTVVSRVGVTVEGLREECDLGVVWGVALLDGQNW